LSRIDVVGLIKKYHYQPVLDDLSITLADGDFCVLVGANGAGKTTFLRASSLRSSNLMPVR